MAKDTREFYVRGNGSIYAGVVGTAAPTDATTALNAAFKELGYTETGFTLAFSKDIEDISSAESFFTTRRLVTGIDLSVSFNLQQWNEDTITFALGGGTFAGVAPARTFTPPAAETLGEKALVAEVVDGVRKQRWYFPKGIVTDLGEISFPRNAIGQFQITWGVVAEAGVDPYTTFYNDAEMAV